MKDYRMARLIDRKPWDARCLLIEEEVKNKPCNSMRDAIIQAHAALKVMHISTAAILKMMEK